MKNRVTKLLGIKYPIIQAPMNWITDAAFVSAVSNAGGLGVLGPNAGHKNQPNKKLNSNERLRLELRKIQELTDKPFGLNLNSPADTADITYEQKVLETALEEGVKIFVTVGTVNKLLFKQIIDSGATLIHREITPTPELAREAESAGAHIIIATGYDEGGWIPQNQIGTFSIIPTIVDSVSIPVIGTGGINDIRGVRAALALGAEAVYVGTRFIASAESPAAENVKRDIVTSKASELVFVSNLQRSTPHKLSLVLNEQFKVGNSPDEEASLKASMLEGKMDEGIISVNTAIDLISDIKSVTDIINELMKDFTE